MDNIAIKAIIVAWQLFLQNNDWQGLIRNYQPIYSACGIVYELPNYLNHENESFAIVDMRTLLYAEPHYHPDNVIEIYFVLQGQAVVVVENKEQFVKKGDIVIIPPNKAHFTIPNNGFVIAVINIPAYRPEHYIKLTESNPRVEFDYEKFKNLLHINNIELHI